MPLKGKEEVLAAFQDRVNRMVRGLALEMHKRLVLKTPVLTGRARSNWNLAIGSADVNYEWDSYDRSGSKAISEGAVMMSKVRAGDVIFDTNALPYIVPLENGWSRQAPRGMIAITLAELQPLLDEIVRKLKAA